MISFLNTLALPALAAALIPLILHLLSRQRTKKVLFSSLRFLKRLENQRIRQVKLLQILLILLRTLFIVFLVLAFSRPTMKQSPLGFDSNAATTAVILMDDSYSMKSYMGAVTRFEYTQDILRQILPLFSPDDHVYMLSPSRPKPYRIPGIAEVQTYLADFRPGYTTPDFNAVLQETFQLFASYPNINRELYFVSDLNINDAAFLDSLNTGLKEQEIRLFLIAPPSQPVFNNLSIDSITVRNQIFEINKPIRLDITVRNHNTDEELNTLVHLFRSDERVAMDQIAVPAGASSTLEMVYIPKTAGKQFLHLEIEEDDLTTDNYYFLNLDVPENLQILYVTQQLNPFVQNAIETLSENTILNISQNRYRSWQGNQFDNYALIVLQDPPEFERALLKRLHRYLENGNSILLIPGAATRPGQVNAYFEPVIKTRIMESVISAGSPDSYFSLASIDEMTDLFLPVFNRTGFQFDSPKIRKYIRLHPDGMSLLKLRNGDSFVSMFGNKEETGNLIVINSGFDETWSDISLKGFFVPFLYRIMYIGGGTGKKTVKPLNVDEPFTFKLSNQSINSAFKLKTPDDREFDVIPAQSPEGLQFVFTDLTIPGHYIFYRDDRVTTAFSVNVSADEFRRPFVDFSTVEATTIPLNVSGDVEEVISTARSGFEIWPFLVILALLSLLAEMLLIKKIEGRPAVMREQTQA